MTQNIQTQDQFTKHGHMRMHARGFRRSMVEQVLTYGRRVRRRGALFYVVGRKEVKALREEGIDLRHCEGMHVLCAEDGAVVTVYRNHDFASLRDRRRHRHGDRRSSGRR